MLFYLLRKTRTTAVLFIGVIASITLSFNTISIADTPYPECAVSIKASEGTNKLNKVIECLNKKVDTLYGVASKDAKSSVLIIEDGKPITIPLGKCVNINNLPTVSKLVLHEGIKFCDKDGWVWIRAFYGGSSIYFRYTDSEKESLCYFSGNGCDFIEPVSKQKYRAIVERIEQDGKKISISTIRKIK